MTKIPLTMAEHADLNKLIYRGGYVYDDPVPPIIQQQINNYEARVLEEPRTVAASN